MTAVKAVTELSMGRPRMKASTTMKHTALMGVLVQGLTLLHSRHPGTAPSREKDQSILRPRAMIGAYSSSQITIIIMHGFPAKDKVRLQKSCR